VPGIIYFFFAGFSWQLAPKGERASFADAQECGRGLLSAKMSSATTYGCLSYVLHAMFAADRCASVRADSRDPMADSVLIAGHAGTDGALPGISPSAVVRLAAREVLK
jgi:hypothetical protein